MIQKRRAIQVLGDLKQENIMPLCFVFPAELLQTCARRVDLVRWGREQLVYIVGESRRSTRVARKIVEVPTQGDLASVCDSPQSLSALLAATRDGSALMALAHSHPEWYPSPSQLDWNTQAQLEIHYDLIGLIFGLGGFVRFYRVRPFEVEIQGEGIEEVRPGVYRLSCSGH